jgi:hypothetical protein
LKLWDEWLYDNTTIATIHIALLLRTRAGGFLAGTLSCLIHR